ncbi:MAG TPA: O-antigen ligase family protein [Candidatus Angelobacter sp.]
MLAILCFVTIAVLAGLALTRHRVIVICGFYSFYALLSVLDPDNVPRLGPVTIYRAIYLIALISLIARLVQDSGFPGQIRRWPMPSYLVLLTLVLASALYSQTSHTFSSEAGSTVWDIAAVFSLFWIAAAHIQQKSDLKIVAGTTVAVSLVLSAWVIWNAAQFNFEALRGGIQVNQNYVSQFVLTGGLPLLALLFLARRRLLKLLAVLLLLCVLSGSLILASRGIFAAFVGGAAWMLVAGLRGRSRKTLFGAGVVLVLIFGFALLLPGGRGLLERFQEGDVSTFNQRTILWSLSAEHFGESGILRMFFGQGLSSQAFVLAPYLNSDLTNYHNQYLKFLMEQGVVGAVAFLVFLYAIIRRVNRSHHPLRAVMLGWLGFLLVSGLTSTIADSHQFWIFLGVMAGVCSVPLGSKEFAAMASVPSLGARPFDFSSGALGER